MITVKLTAAPAAGNGGMVMSDLSKTIRDTGADMKEGLRKADGDESLGDKAAGLGDRVENVVKDAGDTVHETADDASRDASYQKGRADEMNRS